MKLYEYNLKKELNIIRKDCDWNLSDESALDFLITELFKQYGSQIVIRFHISNQEDVFVANPNFDFVHCDYCDTWSDVLRVLNNCEIFSVYDFS